MDVLESKEFFSACEAPTDDFQNFLGIQSKKKRRKNYVGAEKHYRDTYPEPQNCADIKPTIDGIESVISIKKKDRDGAKAKRTKNNLDNEINILTAMRNEYSRLSVELCAVKSTSNTELSKQQGVDFLESSVIGEVKQNKKVYYIIGGAAVVIIGIIYAISKK